MRTKFFIISLVTIFFFYPTELAYASVLDDIVNQVKNIVSPAKPTATDITITASITLAKDGDTNKNGQIDAGDTIKFTYTLSNPTGKKYPFGTLNTGIERSALNFITSVSGVSGIDDKGKTIIFPNLSLYPHQQKEISFEARVNYYTSEDKIISTEAEFVGKDKKSIKKIARKEIKAKRIKLGKETKVFSSESKKR